MYSLPQSYNQTSKCKRCISSNAYEVREQIKSYCQSKTNRESDDEGKQEVDKVSDNITKVLSTRTLDFSTNGYISLCRRIFEEGEKFANKYENMTS